MRIVAHRGASALAPENTLEAFERAIIEGADYIETDLRLTQDGAIFCLHDATLARTFGDPRTLAKLSAQEASALGVPSLEELLALADGRIGLWLELKEEDALDSIVRTLEKFVPGRTFVQSFSKPCVVQSFSKPCVRALAEALPKFLRFQLTSNPAHLAPDSLDEIAGYAHGIAAHFSLLDAESVVALHTRNIASAAWTVNDPTERDRLRALGIDALITDALFFRSALPVR